MLTLVSRLRSVWNRDRESADGLERDRRERPDAGLYECQSCGAVFIATEKDTCSSCDDEVEEVPSSLSEL